MFRHIRNLVLSALFSLLLSEATARVVLSSEALFQRVKGPDDSSRRLAFIKRHSRGQGLTYKFDVYDPVRGWAVAPGLRDVPVFDHKILSSNSRGIRGKAEYSYARVPGNHRILSLGDSYTFGDEVSDAETFSSVLAALLPNTEVLNLGVHGYGHDQMLLYFKREGVKYRPDIVILGYVWFDQERNMLAFNDFAKPKFEVVADGLRLRNTPVPTPEAVLAREPFRSKLIDLIVMTRARVGGMLGWDEGEAQALTSAIFDDLVKSARENGAIPVFVYLPVLQELADHREGMSQNELALDHYCRSRGVACLFLRPRFRDAMAKGAVFSTRRHWRAPHHLLAAQAIREFLTESNLLAAQGSTPERIPARHR